nr:hypothetical protein 9 [bacterium]
MEITYETVREILAERRARKAREDLVARLSILREWVLECRERDMEVYRRLLREIDLVLREAE